MAKYGWGPVSRRTVVAAGVGLEPERPQLVLLVPGIPQGLARVKMGSFGADWATNPETRITGLSYIDAVYGSSAGAPASSLARLVLSAR